MHKIFDLLHINTTREWKWKNQKLMKKKNVSKEKYVKCKYSTFLLISIV
jgi:hypothetical protein